MCKRKENKHLLYEEIKELISEISNNHCIIYCGTKNGCEELLQELGEVIADNVCLGIYHGSLSDEQHRNVMDAWKSGEIHIIIATSAFSMGVNCANVRLVIHTMALLSMSK